LASKQVEPPTGTRSSTCPSQSSSNPLQISSRAVSGLATALQRVEVWLGAQAKLPVPRQFPLPAVQAFPLRMKLSSAVLLQLPSKSSHSDSVAARMPPCAPPRQVAAP